jgi:hypothetical protein
VIIEGNTLTTPTPGVYSIDLFKYLDKYRVLICRPCATGIIPTYLQGHLYRYYRGYTPDPSNRAAILRWINSSLLPSLSGRITDLTTKELVFPTVDTNHIPSLKVFTGLGCNYYEYTTKHQGRIQYHYNINHASTRRSRGGLKSIAKGHLLERLNREHYGDKPP